MQNKSSSNVGESVRTDTKRIMPSGSDYTVIRFTADPAVNKALMAKRDYHTLCVIHDCFGTHHPETLAGIAARGEMFPINPSWPCCQGEAWYREQSKAL